mmetsp:Transcript_20681/g.46780  ORF Transcript_20681/g.46780 Transcript_20681/m.46780 type:complete len:264 (-) Transcript_20681:4133-4924(-)
MRCAAQRRRWRLLSAGEPPIISSSSEDPWADKSSLALRFVSLAESETGDAKRSSSSSSTSGDSSTSASANVGMALDLRERADEAREDPADLLPVEGAGDGSSLTSSMFSSSSSSSNFDAALTIEDAPDLMELPPRARLALNALKPMISRNFLSASTSSPSTESKSSCSRISDSSSSRFVWTSPLAFLSFFIHVAYFPRSSRKLRRSPRHESSSSSSAWLEKAYRIPSRMKPERAGPRTLLFDSLPNAPRACENTEARCSNSPN